MNFQTTILFISFIITILLAFIIIPILKKVKIGQIERDDGPKSHLKKQGTPTMGGIIFMLSIIICTTISYVYLTAQGETEVARNIIPILCLTIGFGVVGFVDDFKKLVLHNTKGLKPSYKMLGLLIISVLYVLFIIHISGQETETFIPILKTEILLPKFLYIPFAIFVILATTNAINLTDGVDGLSSSVCAIIITCLTVIAMLRSVTEVAILGSIAVRKHFRIFNVQFKSCKSNDGRYWFSFPRRTHLLSSLIPKNAINFNNYCTYTNTRNLVSNASSIFLQKNRKSNF